VKPASSEVKERTEIRVKPSVPRRTVPTRMRASKLCATKTESNSKREMPTTAAMKKKSQDSREVVEDSTEVEKEGEKEEETEVETEKAWVVYIDVQRENLSKSEEPEWREKETEVASETIE